MYIVRIREYKGTQGRDGNTLTTVRKINTDTIFRGFSYHIEKFGS